MRLKQWKARDFYCYKVVNKTEHLDFRKKKKQKKKQKNSKPWSKCNFDPLLKYTVDIVSFSISRPL